MIPIALRHRPRDENCALVHVSDPGQRYKKPGILGLYQSPRPNLPMIHGVYVCTRAV